jgi:hypothetical protein
MDEEDEENAGIAAQGGNVAGPAESSVLEYEDEDEEEEEEEEDEEFQKIRREHVFADLDFTKRKSKIICTVGYFDDLINLNLDLLPQRLKISLN